mgnify:FL=1
MPLSQRANEDFDVFDCPVDRGRVRDAVLSTMRAKIDYDAGDLLHIAANRLLGIPLPAQDDGVLVCSAYSARAWLSAGWQPNGSFPSIAAPADVVDALGAEPKAVYRRP